MFTSYRLITRLKNILLAGLLIFISNQTFSQTQSDVAGWNTWVLHHNGEVKVPVPPDKAHTDKELSIVKDMIAKRDENILRQITYWDAGAPSYRWNEIGYRLTGPEIFTKKGGGNFWRAPMAWMNIAIYDATIEAWKLKNKYKRKRPFEMSSSIKPAVVASNNPAYPCEHAVTAAAASTVLAYFFPELRDSLIKLGKEAAQSRVYAGVQFPSDVADGWKLGEQVAALVIEQAKKDGSDKPWQGTIPNDPKLWRGEFPVGALSINIKPLLIKSANQFRPPAPPDFAKEMDEMKNFKQNFNSVYLAYRWAYLSGLDIWTDLASQKIFEYHLDKNSPACARIYTLLHTAVHDLIIAIMDAKYAYFGIRPFQYDSTFKPLIGFTPPFPGYPSGHATASSGAATILSYFFPADAEFFKNAAKECAKSRFYAGIHFQTDNEVGLELGEKVAQYFIDNWAKKDGAVQLAGR
jgi:membrane-associated phospholipid phosphatase